MTNELALPGAHDLDALSDPARRIILSVERAKAWLAQALAEGEITTIVDIKAQAEAIRVYGVQKQLGMDAELAATEIIRRAERGIALVIRKGQAEGKIHVAHRSKIPKKDDRVVHPVKATEASGVSENVLRGGSGQAGYYALADGVTDEEFNQALAEAKAEKNLSRVNVAKKVGKTIRVRAKVKSSDDRWADLERLAAEGHSSHQIAEKLGVGREYVQRKAKALGITLHADAVIGRSKYLDPNRMLLTFAEELEALVPSCEMIDPTQVKPEILAEAIAIMDDAMKAINRFRRRLKGNK